MRSLLEHVEKCSVKVALSDGSAVWSYGGVYSNKLDAEYFGLNVSRDYVFVQYEEIRQWFSGRQRNRRKDHPFVNYRNFTSRKWVAHEMQGS